MDTYSVKPGESFTIHRKQSFYAAAAMISLKATNLSFPERNSGKVYSFRISYLNLNGSSASFIMRLEAPYYMSMGTYNSQINPLDETLAGPFNMVEVKSENSIPIVLQVSFTDRIG